MLKRIELINFMSHKHTVLDLAPGLTVLVGPNNCGKSAVVAALQILCQNDNSTYVLRHGEKECTIRVETDDDHVIAWHRKKAGPRYVIDGKTFDRLKESGMPEAELEQLLRLPQVLAGKEQFDIHFGAQKSPIFLLDRPSSCAASFFASSSDAVRLVEMQALHRQKVSEAQRRKKRLEDEARQLNAELEALGPAVDLERRVNDLEFRHAELGRLSVVIDEITGAEAALRRHTDVVQRHTLLADALAGLTAPPELAATQPLEQHWGSLITAAARCTKAAAIQKALAPLPEPPALADAETLRDVIDEVSGEARAVERRRRELATLAALQEPPSLHDTATLDRLLGNLETAWHRHAEADARCQEFGRLAPPPALAAAAELATVLTKVQNAARLVDRWQTVGATVSAVAPPTQPVDTAALDKALIDIGKAADLLGTAHQEVQQAENNLARARADLNAYAEQKTVCPTCGAELDSERLIAHAAGHGGVGHA
jgi:exonuclease SbcC